MSLQKSPLRAAGRLLSGVALGLCVAMHGVRAEEPVAIPVTIKDHRFSPAEITVPSGKPSFLDITNQDAEAEEFELQQLAIEKVIVGGGHARVRLRPLGPGRYSFIGEFHAETAHGAVIAQ